MPSTAWASRCRTGSELEPVSPLYRAFYPDGSVLDVHSDTEAMAAEIERVIGPEEAGDTGAMSTSVGALPLR